MLLLRPQEPWGSVVMGTSVSVCLSVRTRVIFTSFCVHVAYGPDSVLLQQGDEIHRGKGSFGGFSSPLTTHCTT